MNCMRNEGECVRGRRVGEECGDARWGRMTGSWDTCALTVTAFSRCVIIKHDDYD